MKLTGIHHVSALTAHAAENFHFYTNTMGMRLVKKTVNQDDTSSYHLFYGDKIGNPGTELTFFDLPHAGRTRQGVSSISAVSLRVPDLDALHYWSDRLKEKQVDHDAILPRAGRDSLAFRDFEGQRLILVADDQTDGPYSPWDYSPVPRQYAIRGLGPVTLTVHDAAPTVQVLTDILGFRLAGTYPSTIPSQPDILVFATGSGEAGAEVHVEERADLPPERLGRGGVHHVAFRVPDQAELQAWLNRLSMAGLQTSGIVERYYFQSIYFREPNGILFELATDGPGFTTDEDPAHLGEKLALPPFLEPRRAAIESQLKPLDTRRKGSGE